MSGGEQGVDTMRAGVDGFNDWIDRACGLVRPRLVVCSESMQTKSTRALASSCGQRGDAATRAVKSAAARHADDLRPPALHASTGAVSKSAAFEVINGRSPAGIIQRRMTTSEPIESKLKTSATSSFVMRMQPRDSALPTESESTVPWIP